MNVLRLTSKQLNQIINLLERDKKDKLITNNYFVSEENIKILEYQAIQQYFTHNSISNNSVLIEIAEKCVEVINLCNIDFSAFGDRTLEPPFNYINEEKKIHINSELDFNCILSKEDDLEVISDKDQFVSNYKYNIYQLADITRKCKLILKWISAFDDKIKKMYADNKSNWSIEEKKSTNKPINHVYHSNAKTKIQRIHDNLSCTNFYQIHFLIGRTKQRNNNSFITIDNWDIYEEAFFEQRMEKHNEKYNLKEKIELEIEIVDKLFISSDNYRVITKRYKNLLNEKLQNTRYKKDDDGNYYMLPDENDFFQYPVNSHELNIIINFFELTPSNWYDHIDKFFKHRQTTYNNGYTLEEIATLELKEISDLKVNKEKYTILKNRYIKYLNSLKDQDNEKYKNVISIENLPSLEKSIITHYGCSDFNKDDDIIYWIGAIEHKPTKKYFFSNKSEINMIEEFKAFIDKNKNKTFIHWSMNTPAFGFKHIEKRYKDLTGNVVDLHPKIDIDLSEYLKTKYGVNYIDRDGGRLNNIAKLNNFSGIQNEIEVKKTHHATNRLELIFSIYQTELQGNLKTNNTIDVKSVDNKGVDTIIKNNSNESTSLADKIEAYFGFFLDDCPRKGRPILKNEEDFRNLIKWITYFFENKFKVPEIKQPIRKVSTNKYITQLAFQILFEELKKDGFHNITTKHQNLFTLWESIFSEYKGYKEDNFWKVKRKNNSGKDFDEQVREMMGL